MLNYERLPEHDREGARMWIENGVLPGDFLRAVISNNLKLAFMYADEINTERMKDIVSFWYNEAPMDCWGSEEKVTKWFSHSGFAGIHPGTGGLSSRRLYILQTTENGGARGFGFNVPKQTK
jgi:hypothetical protein